MDLREPRSIADVAAALRDASARGRRVGIVGGRRHLDKGNVCEVDEELSTAALHGAVSYDPAEMLAVVDAGTRIDDLRAALAEGGQEWPSDAPDDATVGGTIASAATSPRRLRTGPLRDSVVEMHLVTGDGRLVRSGARTVKSVQGYDVHRLATGSLGTLGAIVRVAIKVRPLPEARRVLVIDGVGLELAAAVLARVPLAAAMIATPGRVEIALEGWRDEVEVMAEAIRATTDVDEELEGATATGPEAITSPVVVQVAVPPSRLEDVLTNESDWRALAGVGIAWVGLPNAGERLAALRRRVAEAGGIAPVIRGPGGLGDAPVPALDVHRRLKAAFDPANILAPGRFWGGL